MLQRSIEIVHFKCGLDEVGLAADADFLAPNAKRDMLAPKIDGSLRDGRGPWDPVIAHDRGSIQPVALFVGNLQERTTLPQFRMLPKPFLQIVLGAALNRSHDELVDALGADLQLLVHRSVNAVAHLEVGAYAKSGQHDGENRKIPRGQAEPDWKRHHPLVVSRMVYPVPRTVWISFTL